MAPEVSVVIPIRNEALNIPELYAQLTASLTRSGRSYELVLVEDGSTDSSFDLLAAIQRDALASRSPGLLASVPAWAQTSACRSTRIAGSHEGLARSVGHQAGVTRPFRASCRCGD
jgi:cellulose synthase/poly-beta-1,6-N-acetylglucosamine synthase-like glycosyltransferase